MTTTNINGWIWPKTKNQNHTTKTTNLFQSYSTVQVGRLNEVIVFFINEMRKTHLLSIFNFFLQDKLLQFVQNGGDAEIFFQFLFVFIFWSTCCLSRGTGKIYKVIMTCLHQCRLNKWNNMCLRAFLLIIQNYVLIYNSFWLKRINVSFIHSFITLQQN